MDNYYIIATIKNWHIDRFNKLKDARLKKCILLTSPDQLTYEFLKKISPKYIFFPHWSWIVPDEIIENFECVCFHSSDVPYGRGGSPIQNLIIRGHKETKITALRMVKELDAGDVYLKRPLSLEGRAQDIFEKSSQIIFDMIQEMIATEPQPKKQIGDVVVFKRRIGEDNLLPIQGNLGHLYDHIRMLDAQSYPSSHIIYGDFKLEFSNACYDNNAIEASVRITKN